jgi:hypothetical protein
MAAFIDKATGEPESQNTEHDAAPYRHERIRHPDYAARHRMTEAHRPADPLEAQIALADGGVDAVQLFLDRGAGAGLVPALAAGGGDGELAGLVDAVQHVAAGALGHALAARA